MGKHGKVVKEERIISRPLFWAWERGSAVRLKPFCNRTTRNCIFSLDTTRAGAQNPGNFSDSFRSGELNFGCDWEKIVHRTTGGKACSICLDGPCNVLIRSARHAATGCELPMQGENCAAIAALRSAMSRLRWAHACGCVHVRWGVTVRTVHPAGNGSLRERSQGRSSRFRRDEQSPPFFP